MRDVDQGLSRCLCVEVRTPVQLLSPVAMGYFARFPAFIAFDPLVSVRLGAR